MPEAMRNAEEIAYWNAEGGARWSARAELTERVFAPLTAALMDRAGARVGERVLDVGCGCGGSSVALARAVGPAGSVVGVDVSRPMLAVAKTRDPSLPNLTFVEADASAHPFPATFDLALSRFGVMFFDDPVAAFANIRRAVSAGRIAFMCWREPSANPWQSVPARAVEALLPPAPARRGDRFAFADPERTKRVLGDAGFREIRIEPHDAALLFGNAPEEAAEALAGFGSVGPRIDGVAEPLRAAALAAIADAVRDLATADGVALGAGTWIVTAKG